MAGTAILVNDWYSLRGDMIRGARNLSDIIAANVAADLAFDDRDSAKETLAGLRADPYLLAAHVHSADGSLFASYVRAGAVAMEPRAPSDEHFEDERLIVRRKIESDGQRIGSVGVQYSMDQFYNLLYARVGIVLLCMGTTSLVVVAVSGVFQRTITSPVLALFETAEAVSQTKDFSLRAVPLGSDELGKLTVAFNEMLAEVQARERALSEAHDELENRVKTRTTELTAANTRLENEVCERKRLETQLLASNHDLCTVIDVHQALFDCQSAHDVAKTLSDTLVRDFDAHFAPIWRVGPGDECTRCDVAQACEDKEKCLHLVANAGHGSDWDAGLQRVPMEAFKIGLMASEGVQTVCIDAADNGLAPDKEWAAAHGLRSFAAFPVLCCGKVVAVMAMFAKRDLPAHRLDTLELLAQLASSALESVGKTEALRDSEEKFRSISASAQDGIVMVDNDAVISYWNQAATTIFGFSNAEAIGSQLHDLICPEHFRQAHDRAWPLFQETGTGAAVDKKVELEGLRKNGEVFPVELSLSAVRIKEQWHAIGLLRDISERKQTEIELRKLSVAVEQSPVSVVITDPQGTIEYVNPMFTETTGYTREEAIGKNPRILKSGSWKPEAYETLWATIRSGALWRGEFRNKRKNGELFWESAAICPIRGDDGSITHFLAVKQDITERKKADEELAKANQELQNASRQAGMAEIATGVLHNVGNVLNSVNVSASMISEKLHHSKVANLAKAGELMAAHRDDLGTFISDDPKGKQLPGYLVMLADHLAGENAKTLQELESLSKNVDHIKAIIATQQSYAGMSGFVEDVKLVEVINDVLKMNSNSFERHRIEVKCQSDEIPPVALEKHKLLQILVNLIRNAVHALAASPRHSKRLDVRIKAIGAGRIQIEVNDNGTGIPEENMARIFTHGFTTKKEGHGFGLHASALAAKELGGALTVHSDGPDKGATFTLELPIKTARVNG